MACSTKKATQTPTETVMIQIGSKEEVALLLALFGTHIQPVRKPRRPRR
jgi:hypothetical protein